MILVIGEALIDLIGRGGKQYEAVVGGANANVAVALAVRGEKQAFLGRISSDGFGQLIRSHLLASGVNLDYAVRAEEQTSLAVANIDDSGVASYSFYLNGTADWGWQDHEFLPQAKLRELNVSAIQYGCLGMAIGPGNEKILSWLETIHASDEITLSHDLNIRPALGFERDSELSRVLKINEISHIIKASDADVEWLYGTTDVETLEQIFKQWSAGKLVVITRGSEGVSLYQDQNRIDVPGFKVEVQDTVGAGDTFIANFLSELKNADGLGCKPASRLTDISEDTLISAAQFANAAASLVCEKVGCVPPSEEDVIKRLKG